jgi:(p)ppGpp synthase/HD superfamily hydrolase
MLVLTPLEAQARAVATRAHAGQKRKGTDRPYIVHPEQVAAALARHYPDDEALICAGYLHDTLEDTVLTFEEIRGLFGPEVARLVLAVTARKGPDWQRAKDAQLADLARADREVLRLTAADALSNASAIAHDRAEIGPAVWKRFRARPDQVRWYYGAVLERVRAGLGHEAIVAELAAAVQAMGGGGEP